MSQVSLEEVATKCGVSLEYLDQPCSREDLLKLAPFCDPWELVGKYLNLSSGQISAIDGDKRTTEEKRVAILEKWKECASFRATYRKLVGVFLAIESADKAFEMCHLLKQQGIANLCITEAVANSTLPPATTSAYVTITSQAVSDKQESTKITQEVRKLEKEYAKVVIGAIKLVKRNGLTMDDLSDCFVNLPPSLVNIPVESIEEKIKALPSTATTRDFFKIVQPYSDFLNPGLLEHLVDCFEDSDLEKRMIAYLNNLQIFRKQTKMADFADKWVGVTPPEYSELTLEMDEDWTQKTLEEFEQMKVKASIKKWLIKKVSVGSLIVVFSVPPPAYEDHYYDSDLDYYNIDDLLEQQPLKIELDGECVLDREAVQSFIKTSTTAIDTVSKDQNTLDNTILEDVESSDETEVDRSDKTFILPNTIQFGFNQTVVRDAVISSDGLHAEIDGDGIVYGARPLRGTSEFEVETNSVHSYLVIRYKRGRQLTQKNMPSIADKYCLLSGHYISNTLNSIYLEYRYTSRAIKRLEKGDRVGMQLTEEGDLSFLINGKSLGIAAKGVYKKGCDVYPVIILGKSPNSIKVSRAVMRIGNLNLQELCLEEIASYFKTSIDIELLPLPKHLKDILKEYVIST